MKYKMIGSVMVVSLLAACGQRTELIDCDGEVELRGNERTCLDDLPEPSPEPSPEPTPEPAPKSQPEPTPEPQPKPIPEPEPTPTPEPTPEPEPVMEGYATDDRGFPVPAHEGSFRQIAHYFDRACVIDEFDALYCWSMDLEEGGVQRPSRIAPVHHGVIEVSLSNDRTCVLLRGGHGAECLDSTNTWRRVFTSRLRYEQLSMTDYDDHFCALNMSTRQVFCMQFLPPGSDEFVSRDVWFEPEPELRYRDYDLANMDISRGNYFAALHDDGLIEYMEGWNTTWDKTVFIGNDVTDSDFVDVHQSFGYIAALTEDGHVQLYSVQTNEESGYLYLESPDELFSELYSDHCGLSTDGRVLCWYRDPRLPNPDYAKDTWTVYENPVSLSLTGSTYCAISQSHKIDCGYIQRDRQD